MTRRSLLTAQELRAVCEAIVQTVVSDGAGRIEFHGSDGLLKVYRGDELIEETRNFRCAADAYNAIPRT